MFDLGEMIVTVIVAVMASSGFWAFLENRSKNRKNNNPERKMLLGLGHDMIMARGMAYIERGWITKDEYENLHDYLYRPYKELNGNGSGDRIMQEVQRLPIHAVHFAEGVDHVS